MKAFAADARGVTALEYCVVAALISIFVLTAMAAVGTTLSGFFSNVSANLR